MLTTLDGPAVIVPTPKMQINGRISRFSRRGGREERGREGRERQGKEGLPLVGKNLVTAMLFRIKTPQLRRTFLFLRPDLDFYTFSDSSLDYSLFSHCDFILYFIFIFIFYVTCALVKSLLCHLY